MVDIDDDLVDLLRHDGRASYTEIAHRLLAPRAQVAERVRELVADGTLRITASVHPELLGLRAIGHVSVQVRGPATPVVEALVQHPSAVLVSAVSGAFDVVAELRTTTLQALYADVSAVRALEHVARVETLVYVDVPFGVLMPSRPGPDARLDDVDRRVVTLLSVDGRMSYADLGERLGVSAQAARRRVVRMREEGLLRIGATVSRRSRSGPVAAGVGVNVSDHDVEDVVAAVEQVEGVEFVATTLGRYDVVATLGAGAQVSLRDRVEQFRHVAGVHRVESWVHLQVFKERYDLHGSSLLAP